MPIEALTREVEKSCQNENAAWMTQTITSTMASAKLISAGGRPRGFQAMKTNMAATKRIAPKPPNR